MCTQKKWENAGDVSNKSNVRTRLWAQVSRLAPSKIQSSNILSSEVKGKIVKTLLKLKNSGLKEQTIKILRFELKYLTAKLCIMLKLLCVFNLVEGRV